MDIAREKLIIALDDLEFREAISVALETMTYSSTYKIGLAMFSAYGPSIVHELKSLGLQVFLDLKLHDIPMQVAKAVERCLALSPRFLTLHALGGRRMLEAAGKASQGSSTSLLAVTVLTSFDEPDWRELGFSASILKSAEQLAKLASESGILGLVCSAHEARSLKERQPNHFLMCPGVRLKQDEVHDQQRVLTPFDALRSGADALVVGRPITAAKNIKDAAKAFWSEINEAVSEGGRHALGRS